MSIAHTVIGLLPLTFLVAFFVGRASGLRDANRGAPGMPPKAPFIASPPPASGDD